MRDTDFKLSSLLTSCQLEKIYKDEPWASTAFRYLFQTSLAVYLGRLGDENAINHVADLIDTGHARVRQACLVLLSTRIFEDGDPLPTPWVDCLQRLSGRSIGEPADCSL